MRFWWVNQNQTHVQEVRGGFLWSPKTKTNGHRNYSYDTMTFVAPGDVVFSFYDTKIQAIGIVQRAAVTAPKPNFGVAGHYWDDIGWLVEVEFHDLPNPFRPKDEIDVLKEYLPEKYSPLQINGNGQQSFYLTETPDALASVLLELANVDIPALLTASFKGIEDAELEALAPPDVTSLSPRAALGALETYQLTLSRRGQGIFKHNVRLYEVGCRVTQVTNIRHLRASHIKPWSKSSETEKIDGANGLLLSPHVDHLFDRGFISFEANGDIVRSDALDASVLEHWGLAAVRNVRAFTSDQEEYLKYHRDQILIA